MKKFIWIHKDYNNRSLNNLSQNITEYHTAMLLNKGIAVEYSRTEQVKDNSAVIGTLFINTPISHYTVENLEVLNFLSDHNVYFKNNNEEILDVGEHKGSYDCLVSLASGDFFTRLPKEIGLNGNHYVVDISSTAIRKSNEYFKNFFEKDVTSFQQLDFFNIDDVSNFLSKVDGSKGLFVISNCFCYAPTSLLYDTHLRLLKQNKFIELLANHKIDWYVDIVTADGKTYRNIQAKKLIDSKISQGLKVLPWI